MASDFKDEDIRLNIIVNADKAQQELGALEASQNELIQSTKELKQEAKALRTAGKKNTEEYQRLNTQITKNTATITNNGIKMTNLRKEIGITSLTMRQLRVEAKKLKIILDSTTPDTPAYAKYAKRLRNVNTRIDELKAKSKSASKATKGMTAQMGNFKSTVAGLLTAGGIIGMVHMLGRLGKGIIDVTQNLQQTDRRARIVFGKNFPKMREEAKLLANDLGLTNNEFIKAASNTADLLIPLDFSRKKSAELSSGLVQLSGALNEWQGGTLGAAEVGNILTKAMLGENEQLKQLGIAILQDSKEFTNLVKAKMKDEGATRAQAKAMATYELIQKKSADAQTLFSAKMDGVLNRRQQVTTFFRQLKENVIEGAIEPLIAGSFQFELLMMKLNEFGFKINQFIGKDIFPTKPATEFSDAILNGDVRMAKLVKVINDFGLETRKGIDTTILLGKKLKEVYGKAGVKIFKEFIEKQKLLSKQRVAIAAAEEARILQVRNDAAKELAKKSIAALKKFNEKIAGINQAQELALLSKDEREIEKVKIKYQKLIAEAEKLHRDIQDIEILRDSELQRVISNQEKIRLDSKKKFQAELENAQTVSLDKTVKEINAHYDKLKAGAMSFGLEINSIELMRQANVKAANDKFAADELKQQQTVNDQKIQLEVDLANTKLTVINELTSSLASLLDLMIKNEEKAAQARLALTLIDIYANAAIGIANAIRVSASSSSHWVELIGAIAATSAAVIVGTAAALDQFNKAKATGFSSGDIETGTAKTIQRAKGKYDVIGADDNKLYKNIPYTGVAKTGIYEQTSLISEKGPELVVDAERTKSLQINYPGLLNALLYARVPQRQDGNIGNVANVAAAKVDISKSSNQSEDLNKNIQLLNAGIAALAVKIDRGFEIIIGDNKLVEMNDRTKTLTDRTESFSS